MILKVVCFLKRAHLRWSDITFLKVLKTKFGNMAWVFDVATLLSGFQLQRIESLFRRRKCISRLRRLNFFVSKIWKKDFREKVTKIVRFFLQKMFQTYSSRMFVYTGREYVEVHWFLQDCLPEAFYQRSCTKARK